MTSATPEHGLESQLLPSERTLQLGKICWLIQLDFCIPKLRQLWLGSLMGTNFLFVRGEEWSIEPHLVMLRGYSGSGHKDFFLVVFRDPCGAEG